MKERILASSSILSTGLLAGAFLYASLSVLPTFNDVPVHVHLVFRAALMHHNSVLMPLLMALSIVAPSLYALTIRRRHRYLASTSFAAAGFALIALLTTRFGNVPINGMIKVWAETGPPQNWQAILQRWDTFHAIRAAAAFASFFGVILSASGRMWSGK